DPGALETQADRIDDEGAVGHHRLDDADRGIPSLARVVGREGTHAELRPGRGEEAEGRGDQRRRLLGGELLRVGAAAREEQAREGGELGRLLAARAAREERAQTLGERRSGGLDRHQESIRVIMAAAANDPGERGGSRAAKWLLAPPSCRVPSGTPRRSSLRCPPPL